jgi:hypothetical protein
MEIKKKTNSTERVLLKKLRVIQLFRRIPCLLWTTDPRSSLPYSQDLTTGLHPEPDESSPHNHVLSLEDTWAIRKKNSVYFRQLMLERGIIRTCEVTSHDSLHCKPSYNQSPSVCSCLYRVSYDVSCD